MNHRTGLDRSQTLLFPERLEDYIGLENLVRFLDAFVAQQDLHALSFAKARSADAGARRAALLFGGDLLKHYLYGYLHRVASSKSASAVLAAESWFISVMDIAGFSSGTANLFGAKGVMKKASRAACINALSNMTC